MRLHRGPAAGLLLLVGALMASQARARTSSSTAGRAPAGARRWPGGCTRFIVPQGFGLGWKHINHRVSHLEMRLAERDRCLASALRTGFIGGSFADGTYFRDIPEARFAFQRVFSRGQRVWAERVSVFESLPPAGRASGKKVFRRAALGLAGAEDVTAVVEGLRFATNVPQPRGFPQAYDPAMGYTMRGLGVDVRVDELSRTALTLRYEIAFETGASPDRPRHNRARRHAHVAARLDVLLVGSRHIHPQRATIAYGVRYAPASLLSLAQPRPKPPKTLLSVQGAAGSPRGFFGLQSFAFSMAFDATCAANPDCPSGDLCVRRRGRCALLMGPAGDYLRSVSVMASMRDYNPATGRALFEVVGHVSNAAVHLIYLPLRYAFTARLAWLQSPTVVESKRVRQHFRTGSRLFALP